MTRGARRAGARGGESARFDHVEYQRETYDRHYPQMAAAVAQRLSHPLLSSFHDRLARRILDLGLDLDAAAPRSPRPVKLFEAGCGEGLLGAAVQRVAVERGLPFEYTGTDLSVAGVDLARGVLAGDLVVGDAVRVVSELPPGSQDIVWAKNLLHHLDDPASFLRSALRAVGPEGRVVIVEPRLWCPMNWVWLAWFRKERYAFLGYRRTLAAFRASGATLGKVEPFGWLPYELAFGTRFDLPRRILSSDDPGFLAAVSRLDNRLTATLPNLAFYAVSALSPG